MKDKGGRPKSVIDWKRADELLIAGCPGTEVAAFFGIAPCTLYDRCLADHGIGFTEYSQAKKAKGESLLREVQYKRALGISDKGDNTMLIWLGKQRLEQSEKQKVEHTMIEKENEITQE